MSPSISAARVAPVAPGKYNRPASPRCTRPAWALPLVGRGLFLIALIVAVAPARTKAEVLPVFLPFVSGGHPAAECAPSYPSVCIAPYPPDLDCADVLPLVNFAAVPPDEHHLDADHDGVACESP